MRRRIASLRQGLVEALMPYGLAERFAHIAKQRGMFSYTGLTAEQVRRLRAEDSVFLVESGRANVAGLDAERLDALAKAIARGDSNPARSAPVTPPMATPPGAL